MPLTEHAANPYRTSATHTEYAGNTTFSTDVTLFSESSLAAIVLAVFPFTPAAPTFSDTVFACPLILIATTTGALPCGAVLTYASTFASPASSITNPPSCRAAFVLRSAISSLYQFSSESGSPLSVCTFTVL